MINALNGRYRKHIAWIMFLLFYGELAGSLYAASNRVKNTYVPFTPDFNDNGDHMSKPWTFYTPLTRSRATDPAEVSLDTPLPEADQSFIDGPGQPEMSSFRSVGADNMVNLFTGDFSYNIPLLDVGGYPVNLFYNAGVSMDQEASWVGLGWNVNPGTVSRNMRGLPDDFNEVDTVTNTQSMKSDLTIGVTGSKSKEILGMVSVGKSVNLGIFYNNRRGLGLEAGVSGELTAHKSLSDKSKDEKTYKEAVKSLSVSGGINLNSQNGMGLSGGLAVYNFDKTHFSQIGLSTSIDWNSRQGVTDMKIGGEFNRYKTVDKNVEMKSNVPVSTNISFARSSFVPSIRIPLTRLNQLYTLKLGPVNWANYSNVVISGYVNESYIAKDDRIQRKPAYGYMYYEEGKDNKDALLDFNRLNDGVYTMTRPVISMPVYTYDVFTINGEGTGGSFRGYRGNIGNIRDNETKDRTAALNVALELGAGRLFHGGTMLGGVFSPSFVNEWTTGNTLRKTIAFNGSDSIYQGFYFKNPGEKAIIDEEYYNNVGKDQLIRPYLLGTSNATPTLGAGYQVFDKDRKVESVTAANKMYRAARDKRTQVISYLTAREAAEVGLDKSIWSYGENSFKPGDCGQDTSRTQIPRYDMYDPTFHRKGHHISEVDVLETDGRRYVYGIPVYQLKQKEFTFSTDKKPTDNSQLVSYDIGENSKRNQSGSDGSFQSQELGSYAHSFLLTGILSPDYVDVTGNGISDDDLGSAVKFNYSRINRKVSGKGNYWNAFKWRMPFEQGKANFNEGLKADNKDNKALYTYGEKEIWYLHSIESKNMVATFRTSDRADGKQVIDEEGGRSDNSADASQKKLDRIDLYTKADFLKKGANAKPIKTVHFQYSYELCPDYPLNANYPGSTNTGKLTLKAVWFSYNGNEKQKNKYQFKYGTGDKNPAYNTSESDRWGTYKPSSINPGVQTSNGDFPYTSQDTVKSNKYAAAWNLQKVLLPSGGTMEIGYEADDYAFVQDKRASLMTKILGFGYTATGPITPTLYSSGNGGQMQDPAKCDHRFVFFESKTNLNGKNEVYEKYLQGFKQLLLKMWVEMPRGNVGNSPAYEPVMAYASIKDYGVIERPDNKDYFYVELEPTSRGGSPIMETVLQFLKEQLPQRAYPGYDVSDKNGLMQFVSAVWGMLASFVQGVMGFEQTVKLSGSCKKVNLDISGARLNSPNLKKIGGGHRVKSIIIGDSWSKMTSRNSSKQGLPDSYYGQLYEYTKTETINGQPVTASSGVASYEPGIGNEENPFREILKYSEKQFLGPTDHSNIELPLAETFFPSPMIGYAKVSVKSIHSKDNKKIKSGVGLQETEYFTTRDFPVITDFTSFDVQSRKHHSPPFLSQILNLDKKDYITLTQGFRVVLNDMNGKIKSQASCPENDYKTVINSTRYYYRTVETGNNKFKLDNMLPVISGPDGKISNKLIGKEVEVMNDFREHFSYTYAKQIPINLDVFGFPPFMAFIPSLFKMGFRDESMFRSATTLKVVNEFGILDSVVNNDKGSIVATKNLVYDAETGDVLLTRTNNEFRKPVYQFNYPAWWAESGMEPAYRNIDLVYKNVIFRNGLIESPHVNMAHFESGDELYVEQTDDKKLPETIGCITGGYPAYLELDTAKRIWAVYTGKDTSNKTSDQRRFIFIDRNGKPYTASAANLRIIRSGKRNLTGTSIGSIVSLKDPREISGGILKIDIKDQTDVVNASVMKFKEKWRGTQMFYTKIEDLITVRQTVLHSAIINPVQSHTSQLKRRYDSRNDVEFLNNVNREFGIQKQRVAESHRVLYDIKSWMRFDLAAMPQLEGVTVQAARLKLLGHNEDHHLPVGATLNIHNPMKPHQNENASVAVPLTMRFTRMLTPWYADNDVRWRTIFNDNPNDDHLNNVVRFVPYFFSPTGEFTKDAVIDVTPIAKGMLANPSVTSGIKISFETPSDNIDWDSDDGRKWRFCFRLFDKPPGQWESGYMGSYMELDYYKCQSGDPIVYQGSVDTMSLDPPPAGYVYCSNTERVTMCLSVYDKKQMNPYIQGVLGNWRPQESYVFYGERRETGFTNPTDLRKDGVIKDFVPFWAMQSDGSKLHGVPGTKWVWNSTITQYNRKGAELENHDALYRYNAGIYGYQETLPTALINNSRLRLSAFDGFEDYFYADNPCSPFCNPFHRHFNTGISTAQLDTNYAHTGRYSWKIPENTVKDIQLKVTEDDTTSTPDIKVQVKKTPYDIVTVSPKGRGWKAYYYHGDNYEQLIKDGEVPQIMLNFRGVPNQKGNGCEDKGNLPDGLRCNHITIKWKAQLQVQVTGYYQFDASVDDEASILVNGSTVFSQSGSGPKTAPTVYLTRGTLHTIEVRYHQHSSVGYMDVFWKQPNSNGVLEANTQPVRIPAINLYPEGHDHLDQGSVDTVTVYCEKVDTVQAVKHQLIDSLNLIPGKKMVASVWVKKGADPCQCATYTGLNMFVKKANGTVLGTFMAKERVIEGWQQFEAVFGVPAETGNIKLEFSASGGVPLFIDDIRLHPFNANMKSFVYDHLTLRLSAELDENNFATFYEYDDEGTPARVKKETRQGIKTISETRSSLQKNDIEL